MRRYITVRGSKTERKRPYTTLGYQGILNESCVDPYHGLRIATVNLSGQSLMCSNCEEIVSIIMYLLIKYAYPVNTDFGKFTIHYVMKIPTGEIPFSICKAITFREGNKDLSVNSLVGQYVRLKGEEYGKNEITRISIRIYYLECQSNDPRHLSTDQIANLIGGSMNSEAVVEHQEARKIEHRKGQYHKHITALNPTRKERMPFIVADTETVLINNIHVPYAVGFLVVEPGDALSSEMSNSIETYFSEDYPFQIYETIHKRSNKMLYDFIERIGVVVRRNPSIKTVYFHNLSRFDGILLLKYFATYDEKYSFKPLLRNSRLYELVIYRDRNMLFRLRDSLMLLPGSLNYLANNLCPQLGAKGCIPHDEVQESNLTPLRDQLLEYMKQDILLLGGIMHTAQEIYYYQYKVDIVNKRTLSSLALEIFRTTYYDQKIWPIHIPNRNEDTFIRRGYYGGHSDSYIPYGENLYSYDVNSLYPFIMKTYPMPGGEPVWQDHLEGQDLDNLHGFIEAYIVCPPNLKRPFLPYRDAKSKTLIFPTGAFVGVYYSEELKYARNIGYQVTPLSGYMFQKMKTSPFETFVSNLFEKRTEAKRKGHDAMSYVYKILMNSLYGRFGINPECTQTEVCGHDRYSDLIRRRDIILADKLSEKYYIVSYKTNTERAPDSEWSAPKISAVQLAAAITACARIHMYPYISREDCYYTDTDSVVLASPIPEDEVSSTELGKLKMEYFVKKGIFLAPKSYYILTTEEKIILKHKGIAKSLVNEEWFETQYAELHKTKQIPIVSNFQIDWESLNVMKRDKIVNLGIKVNTKREPVFDNNQTWVDTTPLNVTDYAGQEKRILEYNLKCLQKENAMKDREIEQLRSLLASISSDSLRKDEQGRSQTSDDPNKPASRSSPTLFMQPPNNNNKNKHTYRGKKKKKKPG